MTIVDNLTFKELVRKDYGGNSYAFSAGHVSGESIPEDDTIYLRIEKDGIEPAILLLTPDEAQAIVCVLSGAVWAELMETL